MKINRSKKMFTKKNIAIVAATIILFGGAVAGLVYRPTTPDDASTQKTSADQESLQQQSETNKSIKEKAANPQPDTTAAEPDGGKTSVAVVITSPPSQRISDFRLRAYIQHPTSEGTCTLTLSANGKNDIVKQTIGMQQNNQISGCQDILIPASELSTGTWLATLSYDSSSYAGTVNQSLVVE